MIASISVHQASEADRQELSRFICGDSSEQHLSDLQSYIRSRALDDYLQPTDPGADQRLIAVRGEPGHRLVAVAVHSSNSRVADTNGDLRPGTEFVCLAISLAVQGDRIDGRSLFQHVLAAAAEDIVTCDRGPLLCFLVHQENTKMLGIARSSGQFEELPMNSSYVCFVGNA